MNRENLSAALAAAGLTMLDFEDPTVTIPAEAAVMVTGCRAEDGRVDETVDFDDPDLVAKMNAAWYAMATRHSLFGPDREFLLAVGPGDDRPMPLPHWARVRLEPEWDIAGAGVETGALGVTNRYPRFVMHSLDGEVVIAATAWQDCAGLVMVPHPHRVAVLRRYVEGVLALGHRSPKAADDARAWLSRS
ncbi:hypothetical protein AB0B66_15235 [Catellatospora sp. NPDC049111]|uniref:Uncharacterized protein n=1 Tax=Catellatospora coxensis TaxID=310354 RepID=A0A8J3P7Q7_9ACTN|nr:hypothetical protein [Catellatospora coxensis]GIG06603.1 hypothetical protein Cco03nite_33030 [Catellatospora coxensis]